MFLEQQISILEWFMKGHVTEDWMAAENITEFQNINMAFMYSSYCIFGVFWFKFFFYPCLNYDSRLNVSHFRFQRK